MSLSCAAVFEEYPPPHQKPASVSAGRGFQCTMTTVLPSVQRFSHVRMHSYWRWDQPAGRGPFTIVTTLPPPVGCRRAARSAGRPRVARNTPAPPPCCVSGGQWPGALRLDRTAMHSGRSARGRAALALSVAVFFLALAPSVQCGPAPGAEPGNSRTQPRGAVQWQQRLCGDALKCLPDAHCRANPEPLWLPSHRHQHTLAFSASGRRAPPPAPGVCAWHPPLRRPLRV